MDYLKKIKETSPLVQHLTNYVTMNDCANAVLAVGASPVMTADLEDSCQIAQIASAVVLNMGTCTKESLQISLELGKYAKSRSIPLIFDPVGAGASAFRQNYARTIMEELQPDFVKGNAAELSFLAGLSNKQKGVDSQEAAQAEALFSVSQKYGCLSYASGPEDYICDGKNLGRLHGGNPTLGKICGTGCMSASLLACFAALNPEEKLSAAKACSLCMKLAGELALKESLAKSPRGTPGLSTFRWALMDALCYLEDADLEEVLEERWELLK